MQSLPEMFRCIIKDFPQSAVSKGALKRHESSLPSPFSLRRWKFPGRRGSMRRSRRCCLSRRAPPTIRGLLSSMPRTSTSTTSPARMTSPSPRYMHDWYKHRHSFMQSQAHNANQAWPLVLKSHCRCFSWKCSTEFFAYHFLCITLR